MYYVEKKIAIQVAEKFGYKYRAFTSLVSDFKNDIEQNNFSDKFFVQKQASNIRNEDENKIKNIIIKLRKKNFSIEDIKISLDAIVHKISKNTIAYCLKVMGL